MISRERFIDLLAMSRFANLPTVWSNGFLGALVGWQSWGRKTELICPLCLIAIGLALSCLYLGGCFLNDAHDLEFDKKKRPDRPIPSGRWQRKTIFIFAFSLMGLGFLLCLAVSGISALFSVGIILCILAYTKWHKITAWSFIFMGGARALIYPTAAFSFLPWKKFSAVTPLEIPVFIILALSLGGYILGISLTARSESSPTPPSPREQTTPVACLCAPALIISGPLLLSQSAKTAIPLLIFFIVLIISVRSVRANHNVGLFVSRTLAAIPLVDLLLVVPLAPHPALWFACPLLALVALGLQRIAPAT